MSSRSRLEDMRAARERGPEYMSFHCLEERELIAVDAVMLETPKCRVLLSGGDRRSALVSAGNRHSQSCGLGDRQAQLRGA